MSTTKSFVPNVTAKNNEKELARLQAQIGNMRQQNGQFIIDEEGKTCTLERKGEDKKTESGAMDLSAVPSVYFCGCKNSVYTIEHRTSKILIENCENITVIVKGKILTACIEIWKCKGVDLQAHSKVKTLQCDIMTGMKVHFGEKDLFQTLVWQDVDTIDITFGGEDKVHNLATGFDHVLKTYPDSDAKIDQFIIRFVPDLAEGLSVERCVRLKNGHLSTEREAADWDRRNETAKEIFKANFLKEAGLTLNREQGVKKIQPNVPCPCNSGKKYKKCCMNKKTISGLHESQAAKTYQVGKDGATTVETAK